MPDDDLHFSRSGTSHDVGMSESEFVREITGVASTDWSMSKGYAAERLEAVAGKGPRQGPQGWGVVTDAKVRHVISASGGKDCEVARA